MTRKRHLKKTRPNNTGKPDKSKSRAGVALVESLVALMVFALFVTGACKLLMSHKEISDMTRAHYTAVNIAKNRLELVRTFEFEQMDSFLESQVLVDSSGVPDREGNYRRTTAVNMVDTNLMELVITVEIRDRVSLSFNGPNETLTTFFAEYL